MAHLNFSLASAKKNREPTKKKEIIAKDVTGIVVSINGDYCCKVKETIYRFTSKSLTTYKKKVIYSRKRDEYGHRIKIIRDNDNKQNVGTTHYCSIAPGLIVRGRLIKEITDEVFFHVVVSYNPIDVEERAIAIKGFKENNDNKLL